MTETYFRRFKKGCLQSAVAKEIITTEDQRAILEFYDKSVMKLTDEDVAQLRSIENLKIKRKKELPDGEGWIVHVLHWPQMKNMCLKFSPANPLRWRYVREDDEKLLFEYEIREPTGVLKLAPALVESLDARAASPAAAIPEPLAEIREPRSPDRSELGPPPLGEDDGLDSIGHGPD